MPSISLAHAEPITALRDPARCGRRYEKAVFAALQPRLPLSTAASAPALHQPHRHKQDSSSSCYSSLKYEARAEQPPHEQLEATRRGGSTRPATAPAKQQQQQQQPSKSGASPNCITAANLGLQQREEPPAPRSWRPHEETEEEYDASSSSSSDDSHDGIGRGAVKTTSSSSSSSSSCCGGDDGSLGGGGGVKPQEELQPMGAACAAGSASAPSEPFRSTQEILFGKPLAPFTGYPVRRRERTFRPLR